MPDESKAIDGANFQDYLEFVVGDTIACTVESTRGHYNDDDVMERARRALFADPKTMRTLQSLKRLDSASQALADKQIENTLKCFNKIEKSRTDQDLPPPPLSKCAKAHAPLGAMVKNISEQLKYLPPRNISQMHPQVSELPSIVTGTGPLRPDDIYDYGYDYDRRSEPGHRTGLGR